MDFVSNQYKDVLEDEDIDDLNYFLDEVLEEEKNGGHPEVSQQ
jgi:hypothetical protein